MAVRQEAVLLLLPLLQTDLQLLEDDPGIWR